MTSGADGVASGADAVSAEPDDAGAPGRRVGQAVLSALLAVAVLVQLVVLYAPSGPSVSPFPGSDKVVHVLVFLVPVAVALLAGLPARLVVGVFAAHAVTSELVQHALLPSRSGDPLDVVADLVGVGLGVLVWRLVVRAVGRRAAAVVGG
ncbi:MAG TPA: VanZ family protein [Ornithinibacter sp.]|nr:VanZ family protein [Ornithinibacter sp.]